MYVLKKVKLLKTLSQNLKVLVTEKVDITLYFTLNFVYVLI